MAAGDGSIINYAGLDNRPKAWCWKGVERRFVKLLGFSIRVESV